MEKNPNKIENKTSEAKLSTLKTKSMSYLQTTKHSNSVVGFNMNESGGNSGRNALNKSLESPSYTEVSNQYKLDSLVKL